MSPYGSSFEQHEYNRKAGAEPSHFGTHAVTIYEHSTQKCSTVVLKCPSDSGFLIIWWIFLCPVEFSLKQNNVNIITTSNKVHEKSQFCQFFCRVSLSHFILKHNVMKSETNR